ncbi:MAG: aminotransferase class I/II-fold pyridoxal phosphate-dependent enzyme [Candidatus Lambdaproteobacteria bacterium]|nr:aminotransferase class I/II-fold pyridoxal phosphate-dependent enzyme [Candidatus Lambdaproteobacteria bacterium]
MPAPLRHSRTAAIALSPIKEIELAAARMPGAVSLAQGIPSFDTPEVIKAYVVQKMAQGEVAKYSLAPGMQELRELVAGELLKDGMRYDPDGEILITAGSIEGIAATLLALMEPGDEIILPSPSYASYQHVIRMAGCVPVFVPLDEERNFDLDTEALARRITGRTRAIFYCNPNNPTGTIYSRAQSLAMLALAETHDLLIVTDEVYKDFLYTDVPYFTPAQEEAARSRVVRIYSFSKAYAMTGWRVGYLHADRAHVTEILKVHDALVTCAPVISQHAAMAALELGQGAIAEFRQAYRRRRNLMLQHLDGLSDVFDYQKPNGAYFVFPRVKDTVPLARDSRRLAFDLLERAQVALVPGIGFGPTGESHLRLSFGRREEDIEEAFVRLKRYFRERGGRVLHAPFAQTAGGAPAPSPGAPAGSGPSRGAVRQRTRGMAVAYLRMLARLYLRRRRPRVVAIAGNQGKTVFKRILLGLVQRRFAARGNPRSYNTEIGLPLAVLGLEIDPRSWRDIARTLLRASWRAVADRQPLDLLVLEYGVRNRGDMAQLLRTAVPEWAVVTGLTPDGEGDPDTLDAVAEEVRILCGVVAPARAIICTGDARLQALHAALGPAAAAIGAMPLSPPGGGLHFRTNQGPYELGGELVGASALLAARAAATLGEALGMEREEIQAYLTEISTVTAPPLPGAWPAPAGPGEAAAARRRPAG